MYPKYNKEIVDHEYNNFLNCLTRDNSIMIYGSQTHDDFVDDVKIEHFYGIKYKTFDLISNGEHFNFVFDNERKNPYINGIIYPLDIAEEQPHQIIHKNDLITAWWKYDSLNKQPISVIKLKISMSRLMILEQLIKATIYVDILNLYLNPHIYEAQTGSCRVDVALTSDSLVIQVNGYTKYVDFIMCDILHKITTFNFADVSIHQFESIRSKNIDNLINAKFNQSVHQAFCHNRNYIFSEFTNDKKLDYLKSLTYDDLLSFNVEYKNILLIIYGTLSRYDAEKIWRGVAAQLMRLSYHPVEVISNKINPPTQLINNNTNDQDINCATVIAYYLTEENKSKLDYLLICRKLLLKYMKYQFRLEVRTHDKFGYSVKSGENTQYYADDEYESIYFFIVSNHKTNDEMKHRIYQFIQEFELFLNNIEEKDIKCVVKSMVDKLKIKNALFYDRCNEFIATVDTKKIVDFDRKQKMIKLYENIDKKQLIKFYHDYILHNQNNYVSHVKAAK
jgi:secreted Zn-dependent insulinase-like peptidase